MANELNRILKLFSGLQHGDCWLGTNYKEVLQGTNAKKAIQNVEGYANNIRMLAAHITFW